MRLSSQRMSSGAGRRLDELQIEFPARALEQRALGHDAEVLASGSTVKPNAGRRFYPVGGAVPEDGLHTPK